MQPALPQDCLKGAELPQIAATFSHHFSVFAPNRSGTIQIFDVFSNALQHLKQHLSNSRAALGPDLQPAVHAEVLSTNASTADLQSYHPAASCDACLS